MVRICAAGLLGGVLSAIVASSAFAQGSAGEPPHRGALDVDVSLVAATMPPGERDYHYTSEMLGGTTPGVTGAIGVQLSPRVGVGAEVSFASISDVLVFDHFLYYRDRATFKETLIDGVVRLHHKAGRIALEPLVAAGLAARHTTFTERSGQRPDESITRATVDLGGGLNVVVPVGRRVAINGVARVRYVRRDEFINDPDFTGIGNVTMQFGGGLRWTFR
jgi:hypothetical protein